MNVIHIGPTLKLAREFRKLTQAQVADRMGCPRTYISKIENSRAEPKMENFLRYAAAINTEGWRLLRWACRHTEAA